jgi:hypothetical protein
LECCSFEQAGPGGNSANGCESTLVVPWRFLGRVPLAWVEFVLELSSGLTRVVVAGIVIIYHELFEILLPSPDAVTRAAALSLLV